MLELTDKKGRNAEVVSVTGCLDSATSHLFEIHCDDLLRSGARSIILDFTGLNSLSSEGLRAILGLSKRIRVRGGQLVFAGIHGLIRDMFDIAGFLDVFPVVDQMEPDIPLSPESHEEIAQDPGRNSGRPVHSADRPRVLAE